MKKAIRRKTSGFVFTIEVLFSLTIFCLGVSITCSEAMAFKARSIVMNVSQAASITMARYGGSYTNVYVERNKDKKGISSPTDMVDNYFYTLRKALPKAAIRIELFPEKCNFPDNICYCQIIYNMKSYTPGLLTRFMNKPRIVETSAKTIQYSNLIDRDSDVYGGSSYKDYGYVW